MCGGCLQSVSEPEGSHIAGEIMKERGARGACGRSQGMQETSVGMQLSASPSPLQERGAGLTWGRRARQE